LLEFNRNAARALSDALRQSPLLANCLARFTHRCSLYRRYVVCPPKQKTVAVVTTKAQISMVNFLTTKAKEIK